ncbi:hypothetical protein CEXT_320721 [Caerostris extrusa]|uniref:Uncharacterized protein n=1 Tax=Caerostris extrusa TaxID=172846 RepID=A0AAV4P324_CAEEX|nr:hypothetical protein CEXT_320721 [Caerostris extrusa]
MAHPKLHSTSDSILIYAACQLSSVRYLEWYILNMSFCIKLIILTAQYHGFVVNDKMGKSTRWSLFNDVPELVFSKMGHT